MKKENKFISKERMNYLRNKKVNKIKILVTQIIIIIVFISLWEILARKGIINSFIMSQPSRIIKTFMNLAQNDLLRHIRITLVETLLGFGIGVILRKCISNYIMVVTIYIKSI